MIDEEITVIDGLQLLLRFADSDEVAKVLKKAIKELKRLYELEHSIKSSEAKSHPKHPF